MPNSIGPKQLCLLLLSLLSFSSVKAQPKHKWKPGYIVANNGDTITGTIVYKKQDFINKVQFRSDKTGEKQAYAPFDIKLFCVHLNSQNVYYVSKSAQLNIASTDLNVIGTHGTAEYSKEEFFAQLLVESKKSLYEGKDKKTYTKHYLIENTKDSLTDLIRTKHYTNTSSDTVATNDIYKPQLRNFYKDCRAIDNREFMSVPFTERGMIKIAEKYSRCDGKRNSYVYRPGRLQIIWGPEIGVNSTHIGVSNIDYPTFTLKQPGYSFNFGLFLNLFSANSDGNWSFYGEFLNTYFKTTTSKFYWQGHDVYATFQGNYLRTNIMLRYKYPYTKVKPFIQGGLGADLAWACSATTTPTTGEFASFRPLEESVVIGAGLSFSRFEVEYRFETGNGFTYATQLTTSTTHNYILLKYCLKRKDKK